jgi:hypothetical protein
VPRTANNIGKLAVELVGTAPVELPDVVQASGELHEDTIFAEERPRICRDIKVFYIVTLRNHIYT